MLSFILSSYAPEELVSQIIKHFQHQKLDCSEVVSSVEDGLGQGAVDLVGDGLVLELLQLIL